ncbi:MAG: acyl carrier protein [Chloracidobacterium sp.]|nr:acyl carrier protein [Chloracidobacterium sp.]
MVATENEILHAQLKGFFSEKLSVVVPSVDTDLVQSGILDSLALVELLAYIENEFKTEIFLDDLEIEDFHSIAKIAEYVCAHSSFLKG